MFIEGRDHIIAYLYSGAPPECNISGRPWEASIAKPLFSFYREHSPSEWEGPASGHTGSNGPRPRCSPCRAVQGVMCGGRGQGATGGGTALFSGVGAGGILEAAQPVVSALTGQRHPGGGSSQIRQRLKFRRPDSIPGLGRGQGPCLRTPL